MKPAGFTLLEILVLLVVLALLVVALSEGLQVGARLWDGERTTLSGLDELNAMDGTLRRLIARMEPADPLEGAAVSGSGEAMEFVTDLPIAAASQRCRVRLMLDRRGNLVLRWVPAPHVIGAEAVVPTDAVLLPAVGGLVLSYAAADAPARWLADWQQPAAPALVRIHLEFAVDDRRTWPDIIVGPRRRP